MYVQYVWQYVRIYIYIYIYIYIRLRCKHQSCGTAWPLKTGTTGYPEKSEQTTNVLSVKSQKSAYLRILRFSWWSVLRPCFWDVTTCGLIAGYRLFGGRLSYIFVFRLEEAGFSETSVHRIIYQTKGPHIPEDCNIKDNVIKKVTDWHRPSQLQYKTRMTPILRDLLQLQPLLLVGQPHFTFLLFQFSHVITDVFV